MKRMITIISLLFVFATASQAQVMNSAQVLRPGTFHAGIMPEYMGNFGIFFNGGFGLLPSADLGIKAGFGYGSTYFGADLEWALLKTRPKVSLVTGVHYWGVMGVDLGLLASFPISGTPIHITSGLDLDINFATANGQSNVSVPVWLPLNAEIFIRKQVSLMIDSSIPLSNSTAIIGGGLNFYF